MLEVWHWLVHASGSDYGAAYGTFVPYDFLSGSGSDLGEITLAGGMLALYRKHTCEAKGCWRLGRHDTAAGHSVCRRHHPDGEPTLDAIAAAHHAALGMASPNQAGEHR